MILNALPMWRRSDARRAAAIGLAVAAFAAVMAKGAEGSPSTAEQRRNVQTGRRPMDFPVSWSAPDRVVVAMKIRNGVPTIPCSVNGQEVWMILDTGSEVCVLEAETARRAGVRTIHRSLAEVEVTGAGGEETALVGVPDVVTVGAWRWRGLPCVVRTAPRAATEPGWFSPPRVAFDILGMSALRAMCSYVTLDYPRGEVVFGFRQGYRQGSPATASRQPFAVKRGVPFVKVAAEGHEWSALVDTGASSKMEIDQVTAARFGIRKQARWINAVRFGLGDAGGAKQRRFECLTLPSVTCLGRNWRKVEAMLVANESKIGSGLCADSRLTIDFTGSQIWLEASGARAR